MMGMVVLPNCSVAISSDDGLQAWEGEEEEGGQGGGEGEGEGEEEEEAEEVGVEGDGRGVRYGGGRGWAGQVVELRGVFVDGRGRVFNASHLFWPGGCGMRAALSEPFTYPASTPVIIHPLAVNLAVPPPNSAFPTPSSSSSSSSSSSLPHAPLVHHLVHQLPLFLPLAPFLPELIASNARFLVQEHKWLHALAPHFLGGHPYHASLLPQPDEPTHLLFVERLIQPTFQPCARPSPSLLAFLRSHHLLPPSGLPLFHANWTLRHPPPVPLPPPGSPVTADVAADVAAAAEGAAAADVAEGDGFAGVRELVGEDWVVVVAVPPGAMLLDKMEEVVDGIIQDNWWHGRVVYFQGGMALKEARALFSRTLLLIAPPGEALDFILFLPPAAVVLELQPADHPSSSLRTLSHSLSLRHHTLFCKYRNLPGQPENLLCGSLGLTLIMQVLSTEVFFSPALPGGSRAERASLRTSSIPGSLVHGQGQVKKWREWATCVGNKGKWVRIPKPRTLPWDYRGVSNMCDRRYLDSHPTGMAYARVADAYAMGPGATEEGWTVREGLKYEWVVSRSTCQAPDVPEEIKAFEGTAKARLEAAREREKVAQSQLEMAGEGRGDAAVAAAEAARRVAEAVAAAAAVDLSDPWLPFNPSVFCERVGRGRRILVVGDSKQYQMVESFLNLMAWGRQKPAWDMVALDDHPKLCVDILENDPVKMSHEFCQWFTFNSTACPGLRIDYLRNDHISIFDSRGPNFDRMPWALPGVADIPSADIIVLNRGQHWTPTPLFVSGVQNALRFVRYNFPDKLIIYRNTPPGHNDCENFDHPLKKRQPTESLPYYWRDLPEQNRLAKELVEQVGGVYLDVEEAVGLRADGHHGFAPERNKTDCLHYCFPGGVDIYAQSLYNALLRLLPPPPPLESS
ncbi:hypothetical protein CLOM_g8226 [Closterium sp. NIES-68]|nr:hypothetical protein CLOM_g8226 [Closterium sp. NIES-68]GJP70562.1 hypothetical protein CLOP_g1488 [Closterium sp. NIES-67]